MKSCFYSLTENGKGTSTYISQFYIPFLTAYMHLTCCTACFPLPFSSVLSWLSALHSIPIFWEKRSTREKHGLEKCQVPASKLQIRVTHAEQALPTMELDLTLNQLSESESST